MTGEVTLDALRLFVALLIGAVLVGTLARRVGLPVTVGLVLVGVVLTSVAGDLALVVTPELVLAVLLPGLIFEAALRTEFEDLRPSLVGVLLLAVPGVLIGSALVAAALHLGTGLSLEGAFVVGAMVAATDPAAVISTFKRLQAPGRLSTIVEAESLLNDGTGIVLFAVAVGAATGGITAGSGVAAFVVTLVASTILGSASGFVASRLVTIVDDHLVELTISVAVAYGTYLLAEQLHLSGIIATVLAGVVFGSYGRSHGLSAEARVTLDTVWEFIGFLLTALIFLLLGLAVPLGSVVGAIVPIGWAVLAVVVSRALVVYVMVGGATRAVGALAARSGRRSAMGVLPAQWLHVLFWSGLRGAVSVALALSLPTDLPDRELLQGITFGVVLFTLLVQGSTADVVVRRLLRARSLASASPEEPASLR